MLHPFKRRISELQLVLNIAVVVFFVEISYLFLALALLLQLVKLIDEGFEICIILDLLQNRELLLLLYQKILFYPLSHTLYFLRFRCQFLFFFQLVYGEGGLSAFLAPLTTLCLFGLLLFRIDLLILLYLLLAPKVRLGSRGTFSGICSAAGAATS